MQSRRQRGETDPVWAGVAAVGPGADDEIFGIGSIEFKRQARTDAVIHVFVSYCVAHFGTARCRPWRVSTHLKWKEPVRRQFNLPVLHFAEHRALTFAVNYCDALRIKIPECCCQIHLS